MDGKALRILNSIMQWIVAPIADFVWLMYLKQNQHNTAIAVLQAETTSAKIRETSRAIMAKLDSIEEALRK